MKEIEDAIKHILEEIIATKDSAAALEASQAVLNLANAAGVLDCITRVGTSI